MTQTDEQMVIRAPDGWGTHLESTFKGLTLCGETFDLEREDVHREPYDPPAKAAKDCNHPHIYLCSDCHSVQNRNQVERVAL